MTATKTFARERPLYFGSSNNDDSGSCFHMSKSWWTFLAIALSSCLYRRIRSHVRPYCVSTWFQRQRGTFWATCAANVPRVCCA